MDVFTVERFKFTLHGDTLEISEYKAGGTEIVEVPYELLTTALRELGVADRPVKLAQAVTIV